MPLPAAAMGSIVAAGTARHTAHRVFDLPMSCSRQCAGRTTWQPQRSYSMTNRATTQSLPLPHLARLTSAVAAAGTLRERFELGEGHDGAINWTGYVHESAELAAAMVEALLDPHAVEQHRAGIPWVRTVAKVSSMDDPEKRVLGALIGYDLPLAYGRRRQDFNAGLRRLIALPEMSPWFIVTKPDDRTHYRVRPRGWLNDQIAVVTRRDQVRRLPLEQKALLAVLLTLYNSSMAEDTFRGRGLALKTGPAVAALRQLPESAYRDAVLLLAAYPGW